MIPCDRIFNGQNTYEENGITYFRWYAFPTKGDYDLTIKFKSTNSPYPQGIWLTRSADFVGTVMQDNVLLPPLKTAIAHYLFKADDYPDRQFTLQVRSTAGGIVLANSSQLPNSSIWDCAVRGYALWVEKLNENHYRFHCNDHDFDDDYDDLVFDVEISRK